MWVIKFLLSLLYIFIKVLDNYVKCLRGWVIIIAVKYEIYCLLEKQKTYKCLIDNFFECKNAHDDLDLMKPKVFTSLLTIIIYQGETHREKRESDLHCCCSYFTVRLYWNSSMPHYPNTDRKWKAHCLRRVLWAWHIFVRVPCLIITACVAMRLWLYIHTTYIRNGWRRESWWNDYVDDVDERTNEWKLTWKKIRTVSECEDNVDFDEQILY